MTRIGLLAAGFALLVGCGGAPTSTAFSAAVATNARSTFAAYDADGDGRLAPAEAKRLALAGDAFAAVDVDGDGAITLAEFLAPKRLAGLSEAFVDLTNRWMALSDADGDGRLSRREYDEATIGPRPGAAARPDPEAPATAFAAADADADGALGAAEALSLVGWLLDHGWRLAPRG